MSITELEFEVASEHPEWGEVVRWRYESLLRAGFHEEHARALAIRPDIDLHRAVALLRSGCPPDLAYPHSLLRCFPPPWFPQGESGMTRMSSRPELRRIRLEMERSTPTELAEIVEEYRHLQAEHRLAGAEGTVRRHLRARLEELEEHFERLLAHLVSDEGERDEWRASLHHGWPSPPPVVWPAQLLFKGRAETGSVVEIRSGPGDEAEVVVDGALVERLTGEVTGDVIIVNDHTFEETFHASAAALLALREWVADPAGPPPWEHAWELLEDGLIDRHFGLTPRGRRALQPTPA